MYFSGRVASPFQNHMSPGAAAPALWIAPIQYVMVTAFMATQLCSVASSISPSAPDQPVHAVAAAARVRALVHLAQHCEAVPARNP